MIERHTTNTLGLALSKIHFSLTCLNVFSHQSKELIEKSFKKVSFELGALSNTWAFMCVGESISIISQVLELEGIESAD